MDFPSIWKALSIILTGAFGILGLLTEFKEKDTGRIKKWGYISLVGIVVTSIAGVTAQIIETSSDSAKALALAKKADATIEKEDVAIHQMARLLSPIGRPTLKLDFSFPCQGHSCLQFVGQSEDQIEGSLLVDIFKIKPTDDDGFNKADMSLSGQAPFGFYSVWAVDSDDGREQFTWAFRNTDVQNYNQIVGAPDLANTYCALSLYLRGNNNQAIATFNRYFYPKQLILSLPDGQEFRCKNLTPFERKNERLMKSHFFLGSIS